MNKTKYKLFVVRKYVKARNAKEALMKEKKQEADDVWVDDDWKESQKRKFIKLEDAIGFKDENEDDENDV